MKTKIFLILTVLAFCSCQGILETAPFDDTTNESIPLTRSTYESYEYYYWCNGVKIPLTKDENKLYIITSSDGYKSVENSIQDLAIHANAIDDYASLAIKTPRSTDRSLELMAFTIDKSSTIKIEQDDIIYCAPYFKTNNGSEIGITNIISVQISGSQGRTKLQEIAEKCNLEFLGENKYDPNIHYLSCSKESQGNALEMANYIYESGICTYAEPEFIIESKPDTYPNDQHFGDQWNLLNNLYPAYDIDYVNTISDFSFQNINDIIVAVVDNGIYNNHEDLPLYNVSYDAHTGNTPSSLYGSHGTVVAGVIGATSNNSLGITGIASGIKIMPISICYTADGERLGISASTSTQFANAIRFAADNGASIINNSWSFSTTNPISQINSAIDYAHTKGCVVVFSSGNDNGAVSQPAAGAPANTLVVGAIDKYGYRSEFSNYGSSLDIVAPGSGIWTTTWTGGYNPYNGTSLAAPHVSAIAGLMLTVNPDLTHQEVSDIIESTARKLPSYTFTTTSGRSNGTWNNEVGYGLVNCYDAVNLAYHYNANNYFNLIEFDYSGSQIEIDLKTKDNIAVIWDWETKDISYINATASSPTDTTITHNYGTTGSRRIIIAETIAPGETAPTSSSALTRFELVTGNKASNIAIKAINSALEYIRIIGGANFTTQTVSINGLSALKELYLVHLKNASVSVKNCSSLTTFATSRHIWRHREFGSLTPIYPDSLDPNVVGGGTTTPDEWPNVPETQMSPSSLSISNCPLIHTLSLENAGFINFSFSGMNNLSYVYLSSQLGKIVGAGSNVSMPSTSGYFLSSAISTLPPRSSLSRGKIVIRAVNTSNTAYIPASIGSGHKTNIGNTCESKNWTLVWDSDPVNNPLF